MKGVDTTNEFLLEYLPPINDDLNKNNMAIDNLGQEMPDIKSHIGDLSFKVKQLKECFAIDEEKLNGMNKLVTALFNVVHGIEERQEGIDEKENAIKETMAKLKED